MASPPPYIYMTNKPHHNQLHQLCIGSPLIKLITCQTNSRTNASQSQIVMGQVCCLPFEIEDCEAWTFSWSILESTTGNVSNGRIDAAATSGLYPEFSFVAKAGLKYTIVGTFMNGGSTTPQVECVLMLEPRNHDKESEDELHDDVDRWFAHRWTHMDAQLGDSLSTVE